jgi:hypothetical protein
MQELPLKILVEKVRDFAKCNRALRRIVFQVLSVRLSLKDKQPGIHARLQQLLMDAHGIAQQEIAGP